MKTLIIFTHPNHQSLSYAFLQQTLQGLKDNRVEHELQVLDLYAESFDPRLVFNEHQRRRDMHKDPRLEKYRQQLLWAEKIILIYPIWWGRPPAMLLGYIDQMFASNFAYKDDGKLLPEGLLKGKSVVCISSMKGPTLYPLFWLNNAHKVLMKKALFQYVGIRRVKFFEFGGMEKKNGKQEKQLRRVYQYFKTLEA
ncbi:MULTISPECIES: NAD(P)H-dependent oxidoreductase [Paenibacillus]|uniref:NAD(P)H-dependent oxidoreductase n=1 Tax=Paenibacillus TaxID=44249 RepID=UPI00203B799E|nr:NAD(P)H-dependent oxidoreductase [Paenibacillus camelliae]MCM3634886.1 NAD(P)H-dependent oxidoreductase [Paenibacillus camelliae]